MSANAAASCGATASPVEVASAAYSVRVLFAGRYEERTQNAHTEFSVLKRTTAHTCEREAHQVHRALPRHAGVMLMHVKGAYVAVAPAALDSRSPKHGRTRRRVTCACTNEQSMRTTCSHVRNNHRWISAADALRLWLSRATYRTPPTRRQPEVRRNSFPFSTLLYVTHFP